MSWLKRLTRVAKGKAIVWTKPEDKSRLETLDNELADDSRLPRTIDQPTSPPVSVEDDPPEVEAPVEPERRKPMKRRL